MHRTTIQVICRNPYWAIHFISQNGSFFKVFNQLNQKTSANRNLLQDIQQLEDLRLHKVTDNAKFLKFLQVWFSSCGIFSVDLYIKDNPHLFRQPMRHLDFNLYNLNSSYSPLLYKIVTLHTQIYNKQNNLHGKIAQVPATCHRLRVLCHPLFQKEAQYYRFMDFW